MALRLATIDHRGQICPAFAAKDGFWPLSALASGENAECPPDDLMVMMQDWPRYRPILDRLAVRCADTPQSRIAAHEAVLLAPLRFPGKVLCAGANYYDHAAEMGVPVTSKDDQRLFFFFKPPRSTVVGSGRTVHRPARCRQFDWEIELAVVFGRTARNETPQSALDSIAAVTVAIDFSARDLNVAPDTFYKLDWVAGKANDTTCPMGPWLVPVDQVPDIQNLGMRLSVNGEVKQNARTSGMIFSVAEQIAELSAIMTMDPGDVLLTGTPAGVGKPNGTFLDPGDKVSAEIEAIGRLDVEIIG